jgi:Ser/Thr protein kinase RdoA (MazF antagonist)
MDSIPSLCRKWRLSLESRFDSKKNLVYKARCRGSLCVLKWFRREEEADWEFALLDRAHGLGLRVPRPLDLWPGRAILMEFIPGENLCDLINEEPSLQIGLRLAEWYAGFHKAFPSDDGVLLKGDSILRNFVWRGGSPWGVDFEESRPGKPAEDIGEIICSILTTDPMFTWEKLSLSRLLIDHYQRLAPLEGVEDALAWALRETARRRREPSLLARACLVEKMGLEGLAEDPS